MAASFPRRESSARPTATARKCWAVNTLVLLLLICVPAISGSMHNMKYSNNIVKTKYGPLRGILIRSSPPIVEAYLGVPYASPPLGNLRYMPPVTPSTWKTTKLADHFSPVCPQAPPVPSSGPEALLEIPRGRLAQLRRLLPLLANQSEDCLYLNVYVPKIDDETGSSTGKKLSTIVYIHGESYEWNSGNPYDGSILAAHGNVIVVTINFRLGVLGFLKTGAKSSTQGNFGLMDLVAGLHWLRENLPAFNGNPENVTLMGHGTGAALANILIVSPVASDLIHRAVLLSGSALSPWALQKDPLYIKRRVAEHTGCHGDLAEDDLAPCLRAKPIADLLSVKLDTPRFLPGFAPFIDGTVIANPSNAATSPLTLPSGSAIASTSGIELADFPTRELLFGLTTIESYLDLSAQDLEFGFNETRRDRILRTYVRNVYHYHLNEIYSALKNEYTDWERPPRNPLGSRDAALELLSDGHTAAPLVRLGYLHSLRGGRSYFLHFRHQSGERDFTQRSGSVRGEDVPFCLGLPLTPLFPYNYTKQDLQISRILIRYLANFAQTGNPNGLISPTNADISHNNNNNINNNYGSSHLIHKASSSITNSNNNNNQNIPESMSLVKEKRRRDLINNRKLRNKRNKNNKIRDVSHLDNNNVNSNDFHDEHNGINGGHDDDGEEKEEEDDDEDMDNANAEDNEPQNPFWDSYDSINQLYLELGTKVEIRNHYRGHKLSMWLSLIPQLHSPGDSSEMSMRHHHFLEESAQYYDGIVRPQLFQKPPITKIVTPPPATPAPTTTTTTPATTTATAINRIEVTPILPLVPTECPPNTTIVPTIAATRPQQNQASINDNAGLLKRLATSHYQSYTTALTVTIAVGCFLLLLNVFIFAAIYYQREKRANDTKKKEELTEAEILHSSSSPSIDRYQQKSSRKSSLQSVSGAGFGEYSCYEEKLHCKEKRALVDLCTVELPMHDYKCSPQSGSNTGSLRRSGTPDNPYKSQNNQSHENLVIYPPCYSSQPPSVSDNSGGGSSSNLATSTSTFRNVQNQSTQSDPPTSQDVGTTINEDDEDFSPDIPDPPPPPKSLAPFGILRQQGGPTTPGSSKKRVQIQEISV